MGVFAFFELYKWYQIAQRIIYYFTPNTSYLSVLSPNAGKYGLEIAPYLDTSHTVRLTHFMSLVFQRFSDVLEERPVA